MVLVIFAAACNFPQPEQSNGGLNLESAQAASASQAGLATSTPLAARPIYAPGELVDYTAQSGDTLPLLAARFNTKV